MENIGFIITCSILLGISICIALFYLGVWIWGTFLGLVRYKAECVYNNEVLKNKIINNNYQQNKTIYSPSKKY